MGNIYSSGDNPTNTSPDTPGSHGHFTDSSNPEYTSYTEGLEPFDDILYLYLDEDPDFQKYIRSFEKDELKKSYATGLQITMFVAFQNYRNIDNDKIPVLIEFYREEFKEMLRLAYTHTISPIQAIAMAENVCFIRPSEVEELFHQYWYIPVSEFVTILASHAFDINQYLHTKIRERKSGSYIFPPLTGTVIEIIIAQHVRDAYWTRIVRSLAAKRSEGWTMQEIELCKKYVIWTINKNRNMKYASFWIKKMHQFTLPVSVYASYDIEESFKNQQNGNQNPKEKRASYSGEDDIDELGKVILERFLAQLGLPD